MTAKRDRFEQVLRHSFLLESFVAFTRELLTDEVLVAPNKYNIEYSNFSFYIAGYTHIANYTGNDGKKIAVFAIQLNKGDAVERARSMQRNFAKKLIENGGCDGALVAFYTSSESKWRLSFVRMDYEFAKGKVNIELTPAKRYSYLVGEGEPCHTAMSRLYPIFENDGTNPSIDELEDAFSVEKVTEEFFGQYCEKFQQLREWLEKSQDFMDEAKYHNFTSEQFAKKLMGQIVFLYFIQKKGWLGVNTFPISLTEKEYNTALYSKGSKSIELVPKVLHKTGEDEYRFITTAVSALSSNDEEFLAGCIKGQAWGTGPKDFVRRLFKISEKYDKNYFNDYLEPLFYNALNIIHGDNGYFRTFHCRIPFLNGGLFEQLDNYDWEHKNFNLPNTLFSNIEDNGREADGILDIFDRYNFTMNEDEPMEKEVAIDPEMLGKIFENLLDVKDRKSKGAYYTPREIVHYMCQESLTNYLADKTGIPYDDIKDFILFGEIMKDEDTVKEVREGNGGMFISSNIYDIKSGINRLKDIDDALASICVADPAVGSGAFPLGMLNEIVRARQNLSAYMSISMNGHAKRLMYAFERHPYELKSHAIKNCIFAVDIEPSAVDITKLRLWLSLVIDDEINPNAKNELEGHSKPRALPNLDCNVICGNSLIDEFEGIELINPSDLFGTTNEERQFYIGQSQYDGLLNQLFEAQNMLFWESSHEGKVELKARIQSLIDTIIIFNIENKSSLETVEKYHKIKSAASLPYCLWELEFARVFKEKGGFDIVIGNPPYLESRSPNFTEALKDQLQGLMKKKYGKNAGWFARGADLLIFFFELSLRIMHPHGLNCFITQNSWLNTEYGMKFQQFLIETTDVLGIIDSDYKYFETADINTVITFFQGNTGCKKDVMFARCHKNLKYYSFPLSYQAHYDPATVTVKRIKNGSSVLTDIKWGFIFETDDKLFDIIMRYNEAGLTTGQTNGRFSIGQGLNLSKSFIIQKDAAEELNIPESALIPFFITAESGVFSWRSCSNYIIDENSIVGEMKVAIKQAGYELFDSRGTRKQPPVLMMPRGIGARHFCCYNGLLGFSGSCVDIYANTGTKITDDVLRLWVFLNSTLCWIIRENAGRKNLGGGMLKAEAIDWKPFAVLYAFNDMEKIRVLFEKAQFETISNAQVEISKSLHEQIDDIVFGHLMLNSEEQQYILKSCVEKIDARCNKSTN